MKFFDAVHQFSIIGLTLGAADYLANLREEHIQNNLVVGVYVASVDEYSAAEKAGIKAGDVIVKADGQEIKTMTELNNIKNTHNIGDTMTVTVNRNGQEKEITLTLQEQ